MIPQILTDRKNFPQRVIDRLGASPIDFREKWQSIQISGHDQDNHLAAGVLLPLQFIHHNSTTDISACEFTFQLIKRSSMVAQAGDLSCPGGMIHPLSDRILRPFLNVMPSLTKGTAGNYAQQRGHEVYRIMTLFLTTAIRESWEEIGLNPFYVQFLGPIPTYSLTLMRRIIFPFAGFVQSSWRGRPNREVEKIIDIPLRCFFEKNNFRRCILEEPPVASVNAAQRIELPAIAVRDRENREEILWGATFNIVISFLQIVLDFSFPDLSDCPVVVHHLSKDYWSGRWQDG
ncbi:MAG: hypothetical protein ABSB79_01100 [Syntrophales bacterium]|jgi:8-oxo-dGTP pyrophosphatase MutT (NUDIX family)